jgi:3-deoxy-alpha-D-manno-octulosonate 8-oxidase
MLQSYRNCKNVANYLFGKGSFNRLDEVISPKRINDDSIVIFIVDEFFENTEIAEKIPNNESTDILIFASTIDEPHADYINQLVEKIKSKIKSDLPVAIVGMGGGTTMDIAKVISVMLTNDGKVEDYQGWDLVKNPGIFKIGIPTISGTGAEATRTAVLTSKIKKLGINSDHSVFDQIIQDSELLETVPIDQFMYTAMDSYIHCVESLRGSTNDAMTIAFAQKSLNLLRDVFLNDMDGDKLMSASYLGGSAVANSNVGICHPISYGLSLVMGYHHGFAVCVAFNQLEEYYPEVKEFKEILVKHNVQLPTGLLKDVSDSDMDRMIKAIRKNEKPLENAFGPDWENIFSEKVVLEILKRI